MPVCSQRSNAPLCEPLPAEPFDMSQWSYARVNIDYHIAFDANFYSVPYTLVQERVEVRAAPTTIEIFHKGQRVASHVRDSLGENKCSRRENTGRRATKHISNGLPHAWCTGPNRSDRTRQSC